MPTNRLRTTRLAALALLLGGCGEIIYDTSSRVLILEPVERMVFESDGGAVEVHAFERTAISLVYALTGYGTSILDVGHRVEDAALRAFIRCDGEDLCSADFYCEVPLGTRIDVRADDGDVKLTGVDAAVEAAVGLGAVEGVNLRSPSFDLTVERGAVTLAWELAPEALKIAVTTGDVALTLPTGGYRCDFMAADTPPHS